MFMLSLYINIKIFYIPSRQIKRTQRYVLQNYKINHKHINNNGYRKFTGETSQCIVKYLG